MSNPYSILFAVPGTKIFAFSGLIARMPIAMTAIGIITMMAQLRDSYWLSGSLAATFTLAMAMIAPQISRAADRHGQSRVLPIATAVSVVSLLCLLMSTYFQMSDWILYLFAALSGTMPSMSSMSRARWSELYRGTPQLNTAFSLESVFDEICFIIGPPISVGLCVAVFPQAGVLAAIIFLVVGVSIFVSQKPTEPAVHSSVDGDNQSAIRLLPVQILALVLIALGGIAGTIDVISVAFAEQQNQPIAASIVLSVYAISSCIAGLVFGAIKFKTPLANLFLYAALAIPFSVVPLLFVNDIFSLSVVVFFGGVFFAPMMIIVMGLIENIVPPAKLTEGLTWAITGLGIGVAIGAALAGWVIDAFDVRTGFLVTLISALIVFIMTACCYKLIKKSTK